MSDYETRLIVNRLIHECQRPHPTTDTDEHHKLYGRVYPDNQERPEFDPAGSVRWSHKPDGDGGDSFNTCPWCGDHLPQYVGTTVELVEPTLLEALRESVEQANADPPPVTDTGDDLSAPPNTAASEGGA